MSNIKHSKGFIPLVFLLYGGVALLVGLTGFLGFREYQLKQKTLGIETTVPTVLPSTPEPTQTPKPTSTIQKTTTTGVPSRTGAIVAYHDWCNNKDIKVYQNELITKKSSDGKTYSMTQDDWNCYEKYLASKNTTSSDSQNINFDPTCIVTNPATGIFEAYLNIPPDDCIRMQSEAAKGGTVVVATQRPTQTPAPTIDVTAYNAQVTQCRDDVNSKYSSLIRGCQIQFGDNSAAQACATIYQQDRQSEYNACGQTQ